MKTTEVAASVFDNDLDFDKAQDPEVGKKVFELEYPGKELISIEFLEFDSNNPYNAFAYFEVSYK